MRRRREFLRAHPEVERYGMDLEQRGLAQLVPVHCLPGQPISLVLLMVSPDETSFSESKRSTSRSKKAGERRYLLCPSDVTMGILKKFIRMKFNLPDKYQVDLFYNRRDDAISDDFTLLDVTFIYSWTREKPLRLLYTVYEKPARKRRRRRQPTDRLQQLQPSPAKRARLEPADCNGVAPFNPPHKSLGRPPAEAKVSAGRTPTGMGKPAASKAAQTSSSSSSSSSGQSLERSKQKVTVKKADFWKLNSREKLQVKRTSLETAKKAGRGRKRKAESTTSPGSAESQRRAGLSGGAKSQSKVKSGVKQLPNGKHTSAQILPNSPDCEKKGAESLALSGRDTPSGAWGEGREGGSSAVAPVNGVHRPAFRPSLDSRSASPRLSTPGSSRSSSPRLPAIPSANRAGPRAASPRAKSGKDSGGGGGSKVAVSSRQEEEEEGEEGLEVAGCRGSGGGRADSPRPADLHPVLHADRFPCLPLDEKISVDVSMTASASETSSDVTSPGAEDRANSTGMEEPGSFHGSAGLMCQVAASFASRPFHPLVPNPDKAPGNKHGLSTDAGFDKNVHRSGEPRLGKDKLNSHKDISVKGNRWKPDLNKSAGRATNMMHKVNGLREEDSEGARSDLKNSGFSNKQAFNKEAKRTKAK